MDPRWLDPGFNNGVLTAEERAFLFGRETGNTEYTQWSIEGTVSGPLFDMPSGEVLGAIGFHYREDEIRDVPGEIRWPPMAGVTRLQASRRETTMSPPSLVR
jgi:hypothetical protein